MRWRVEAARAGGRVCSESLLIFSARVKIFFSALVNWRDRSGIVKESGSRGAVMTQVKEHSSEIRSAAHQPTIMETELDSITYLLAQMRAKVQRNGVLEHLTMTERSELQ